MKEYLATDSDQGSGQSGQSGVLHWYFKRCASYSLLIVAISVASKARADEDYYRALAQAEQAEQAERAEQTTDALRVIEAALQKYPGDYELTLTRGRLELRAMHYRAAEQSFRSAVTLSDGSAAARVGLGWALLHQQACALAVREFEQVLARDDHPAARSGIELCAPQAGLHGSAWLSAGGALFRDHPWKRRFADVSAGLSLQPSSWFTFGLAYHFLRVTATDRRVAPVDQHELYVQGGITASSLLLLGHAAMVWSADPRTDGSAHAGLSGRYFSIGRVLSEISAELTVSRYPDVWIGRAASAWRFALGSWSITPGFGLTRHLRDYLAAVSLSLGKSFGALSLWVTGKYGPEYRAAFLSQFALLNSEDRSVWSVSAGLRATLPDGWALLAGYYFLRMHTPDMVPASMHLMNVGAVISF